MNQKYQLYGLEMSPYSVKVRAYLRYKNIPHRWIPRSSEVMDDYNQYAKIAIIPLLVTPEGEGVQDSTPIIEKLESIHPEPSVNPSDPVAQFMSVLLEEFADEWGNKWMFHYRWAREVDQQCSAGRLARAIFPTASDSELEAIAEQIKQRMKSRVWFVGSNETNAVQIESTFREAIGVLDAHLLERDYLFGQRPAFADFSLWGQLYNTWTDPTTCALIEAYAPNLADWIHRMLWPRSEGEFEDWISLKPTLAPFLERFVGALFVPWSLANDAAIKAGQDEFSVELDGRTWTQKPQKYHAKSLQALRDKYSQFEYKDKLDPVLKSVDCLACLAEENPND